MPYIDTQRLSIVWLGLDPPQAIKSLEGSLIGNREVANKRAGEMLLRAMQTNGNHLSQPVVDLCHSLQGSLLPSDGFRKRHTPFLLYKYFSDMSAMFKSVHRLMKPSARFCLIVGYNKTHIGGDVAIDTPGLLAEEATACGYTLQEIIPLETYQRYGLHATRAIHNESLIILKA